MSHNGPQLIPRGAYIPVRQPLTGLMTQTDPAAVSTRTTSAPDAQLWGAGLPTGRAGRTFTVSGAMPHRYGPLMANGDGVPEKVAWVLVRDALVLVTRSHGRDRFYLPGGHREPGESDVETLVREIDEELRAAIDPGSMVRFGAFEIGEGHPEHDPFRMICYTAEHRGELIPSREIAEKAWFRYADRGRVSAIDALVFDVLHDAGRLS